ATQIVTVLLFLFPDELFHYRLGRNTSMVCTRNPKSLKTLHSFIANQGILSGGIKSVTHVQFTGHIGRRHKHGESFIAFTGTWFEALSVQPFLIPLIFSGLWVKGFREFVLDFHLFNSCNKFV